MDVQEVAKVLARAAARERLLVQEFPRGVEDIITLASDVSVVFEPTEGLCAGFVVKRLWDLFKVRDEPLAGDEGRLFAGYVYAFKDGNRKIVIIFSDRQYGEPAHRFTLAHEAGHLFREFVRDIEVERQGALFGAPPAPKLMVARDPPGYVRRGLDAPAEDAAALTSEYKRRNRSPEGLREIKADGFAAELLAPFGEVQRVLRENPGRERDEYVDLLRARFGVSRTMARVRLAELVEEPDPDQAIMDLVSHVYAGSIT